MTAHSPYVKRWVERIPLLIMVLAVGLVVAFMVINPLPDLTMPGIPASVNKPAVIPGMAEKVGNTGIAFDFYAQPKENASVQSILAGIAEYKLRRGWQASAARLSGLAARYNEDAGIQSLLAGIAEYKLRRGWQASAARMTALAEFYAGK